MDHPFVVISVLVIQQCSDGWHYPDGGSLSIFIDVYETLIRRLQEKYQNTHSGTSQDLSRSRQAVR